MQSSPDGGAKDVEPPAVVETTPVNRSTNFNAKRIEIEFDEYVKIEGFTTQFISSPPLKHKVEYSLRGKTLRLDIEDTLRENTTYTFSFGNAIKDITENNPQTDFKYVFSTGAVLDSQVVHGSVQDAFTNKAQSGIMIALYEVDSEDSVFMKETPLYYGLSDEQGHYDIENVAPGKYKIFAIQDFDFNYTWSGGSEPMAFVDETIDSELDPVVDFSLFRAEAEFKFYRGKFASFGKVDVYYSAPAQDVEYTRLDTIGETLKFEYPEDGDTIVLWTNTWKNGGEAQWQIVHEESQLVDTVRVKFYEKDSAKFNLKLASKTPLSPVDSIIIESTTPILSLDPSKISVFRSDSIPITHRTYISATRNIRLLVDADYGDKITWSIDSGAIEDLFGRWNDSTGYSFKFKNDNELSIFHLKVESDSVTTRVLELFDEKGKVVYRSSFSESLNVDLFDIHPQKYSARVIYDRNGNGRWDTGEYFEGTQPEKVIYLGKQIDLRANWEIDETWIIP